MKKKSYSTYEAKTRFSEILRRVRERGETVIVSYHGEPVAEIRPVTPSQGDGLAARIRALEESGVVARPRGQGVLRKVERRAGALARFLAEREER